MGKSKDPEKLLVGVENQRGVVKVNTTSPIYTCTWIGNRVLVGGGGPSGYGLGRPLGCIGYKDSPPSCNYKTQAGFVSAMSEMREHSHASSIAVTLLESSLQFVKFANSGQGHEMLAEYDTHIGSVETDRKSKVVALSPSGRVAVVNSDSNSMHIVALLQCPDSPTNYKAKWCAMLVGHTSAISCIAITYCPIPEGAKSDISKPRPLLIASVAGDNTLRLWITEDIPPANEDGITTWAENVLPKKSTCAGVIPLTVPPSYPSTDDGSNFKLQKVYFSTEGSELHIIMARGEGPSYLVSYQLRWKIETKRGKKTSSLTCQTLQSVCLAKEDAITAFAMSKCNNYIVFGTARNSSLGIATRSGEVLKMYQNYHNAPILSISVKQIDENRLRIATAALSDNYIKIVDAAVLQGMSPLDVLKVISTFVVVLCLLVGGTAYFTESVPLTCILNKIAAAKWIQPSEEVFSHKLLTHGEGVPPISKLLFDSRSLQTMGKDPIAALMLCGPPVAAALLSVVLSSSASFFLILFGSIGTGVVLGDSTLRLMPLCDAAFGPGQYHHRWLAFLLIMFLLDSCFRTSLPNPKLLPTSFSFKKPPQGKLGMSLRGALVTNVLQGGCADIAGLKPGMMITTVNGKPVTDDTAKTAILGAGSAFRLTVELGKGSKALALSYGHGTKATLMYALLQHLVGVLLVSTRDLQYSVVLTFLAALHELAGVTALYCSGNSTFASLLMRAAVATVWILVPAGAVTEDLANTVAPWVVPAASAAGLYVVVAHYLPALAKSTRFGIIGMLLQMVGLAIGVLAPVIVSYEN